MSAGSNSGLVGLCMQYWVQVYGEEKKRRELEDKMNAANDRFASLNGRQKDGAKNVQQRINDQMNTNMFMSFAAQLDQGLGPDSDSARKSNRVAPPRPHD